MRRDSDLMAVLPSWIVARGLAIVGTLTARVAADRLQGGPTGRLMAGPLGWVAWDGLWYRNIAQHGYAALDHHALRFFPLYPLLGRALSFPLGNHVDAGLLVISNVAAFAAAWLLYRLVCFETRDPTKARLAVWVLTLFPAAFVMVWAYAESLFLVATIGAFLAYRKGRWGWAALAGLAAGLTRPVGAVLVIPAVVELIRAGSGRRYHGISWRPVAAVLAPVVGVGAYLAYVGAKFGDWTLPLTVQENLRGKTVDPLTRLVDGFRQLGGPEGLKQALHVPFAIAFLVLLVVVLWRWPVSYGLFAAAVLVASLMSENLNSLERYGLNAFPLVFGLVVISELDGWVEQVVLIGCGSLFVALSTLALVSAYVP